MIAFNFFSALSFTKHLTTIVSEDEDELKHQNFHLNDYIVRQQHQQQQQQNHHQQPRFTHNPSTSATMLYNNYYHPETPLPPLPSFFNHHHQHHHLPSTKAFQSLLLQQQQHQQQQQQHQHNPSKPQIRVRNFPKEDEPVMMVVEQQQHYQHHHHQDKEKDFSHFALRYHERDRLIREHQHDQIKRSRIAGQEQQQERASTLPPFMDGGNSGEKKTFQDDKVIVNGDNSNLMYTKGNSSGQNNGFIIGDGGELYIFSLR